MLTASPIHRDLAALYALSAIILVVLLRALSTLYPLDYPADYAGAQLELLVQVGLLLSAAVGIWRKNYIVGYLLGSAVAFSYIATGIYLLVASRFAMTIGPVSLIAYWLSTMLLLAGIFRTSTVPLSVARPALFEVKSRRAGNQ